LNTRAGSPLSMKGIWTSLRWQSFPRRRGSTHSATMTRTYEVCTPEASALICYAAMRKTACRSHVLTFTMFPECD
jgi:hypothetical protein